MTASIVERVERAIYDAAPYVGSKDEDIPWAEVPEPTRRMNRKRATAALSVICEVLRKPDKDLREWIQTYDGLNAQSLLRALASHLDQRTE